MQPLRGQAQCDFRLTLREAAFWYNRRRRHSPRCDLHTVAGALEASTAASGSPFMNSNVKLALLALLAVGVFDHLFAEISQADSTVRRLGLHQDKSQAYWLYFFIAHIYDGVLVCNQRRQPAP